MSILAYSALFWHGLPCLSSGVLRETLWPEGSQGHVAQDVAARTVHTWLGLSAVYLFESAAAACGPWVTLHRWRPREVLQHHLAVVVGGLPCSAVILASPSGFVDFTRTHPPIAALVGAGALTCANELFAVSLSFGGGEERLATRASAILTLSVLSVDLPMNVVASVRGLYLLLTQQHAPFAAWKLFALSLLYCFLIAFALSVQLPYIPPNVRRAARKAGGVDEKDAGCAGRLAGTLDSSKRL